MRLARLSSINQRNIGDDVADSAMSALSLLSRNLYVAPESGGARRAAALMGVR